MLSLRLQHYGDYAPPMVRDHVARDRAARAVQLEQCQVSGAPGARSRARGMDRRRAPCR